MSSKDGPATPGSALSIPRTPRVTIQDRASLDRPRFGLYSAHPTGHDDTRSTLGDVDHLQPHISNSQRNLTENVIHTLVSKPNDALALLFEAAGRQDPSALNSRRQSAHNTADAEPQSQLQRPYRHIEHQSFNNIPTPHSIQASIASNLPSPTAEALELWKRYRFVRQGWLTALEAVQYVDSYV